LQRFFARHHYSVRASVVSNPRRPRLLIFALVLKPAPEEVWMLLSRQVLPAICWGNLDGTRGSGA
jgi:hypothetical protein